MLKGEFVKKVKEALGLSSEKAANEALDRFTALLVEMVAAGEEISLGGLGKFVPVEKAARKARNPKTGEEIDVPAKKSVKFKPAAALKKACNS